jgi:hypothetical protein
MHVDYDFSRCPLFRTREEVTGSQYYQYFLSRIIHPNVLEKNRTGNRLNLWFVRDILQNLTLGSNRSTWSPTTVFIFRLHNSIVIRFQLTYISIFDQVLKLDKVARFQFIFSTSVAAVIYSTPCVCRIDPCLCSKVNKVD